MIDVAVALWAVRRYETAMPSYAARRAHGARQAPIDPDAVRIATESLLPARLDRDAKAIIVAACDLTRLKIVRVLAETPLAASDVARLVGRTATATSQHIRVLRDHGVIAPTRSGNVIRYRLTQEPTARVLETMARALDILKER